MSQLEEINVRMISLHNSRKQIQQINDLLDVLDTKLSDLWRYKMSHVYESHILWLTQLLISSCRFLAINVHFKNSGVLFLAKWLRCKTLMVWDRPLQNVDVPVALDALGPRLIRTPCRLRGCPSFRSGPCACSTGPWISTRRLSGVSGRGNFEGIFLWKKITTNTSLYFQSIYSTCKYWTYLHIPKFQAGSGHSLYLQTFDVSWKSISGCHHRFIPILRSHFRFEQISSKSRKWNFRGRLLKHFWDMNP